MTITALIQASVNCAQRDPYLSGVLRRKADALMLSQPDRLEIEARPILTIAPVAQQPVYTPPDQAPARPMPLFLWMLAAAALIALLPPFWS